MQQAVSRFIMFLSPKQLYIDPQLLPQHFILMIIKVL
jgi:hypothetical protein